MGSTPSTSMIKATQSTTRVQLPAMQHHHKKNSKAKKIFAKVTKMQGTGERRFVIEVTSSPDLEQSIQNIGKQNAPKKQCSDTTAPRVNENEEYPIEITSSQWVGKPKEQTRHDIYKFPQKLQSLIVNSESINEDNKKLQNSEAIQSSEMKDVMFRGISTLNVNKKDKTAFNSNKSILSSSKSSTASPNLDESKSINQTPDFPEVKEGKKNRITKKADTPKDWKMWNNKAIKLKVSVSPYHLSKSMTSRNLENRCILRHFPIRNLSKKLFNSSFFDKSSNEVLKRHKSIDALPSKIEDNQLLERTVEANFFSSLKSKHQYLRINQYILTQDIHIEENFRIMKCIDTNSSCVKAIRIVNKKWLYGQLKNVGLLDHLTLIYFMSFQLKLKHDCLAKLHEVIDDNRSNAIYFITDYAENGNLKQFLASKKCTNETIKVLFAQIIYGLEYIHMSTNSSHAGIKLENILVSNNEQVKISDLEHSFLKNLEDNDSDDVIGSHYYISPEIILDGNDETFTAIDIWASGIILYYMLKGKFPFVAQDALSLFNAITNSEPSYDGIGEEEVRLLKGILTKDPKRRYTIENIKNNKWVMSSGISMPKCTPCQEIQNKEELLHCKTRISKIAVIKHRHHREMQI